eukprot:537748-Hanusia_phi.AAC.1
MSGADRSAKQSDQHGVQVRQGAWTGNRSACNEEDSGGMSPQLRNFRGPLVSWRSLGGRGEHARERERKACEGEGEE